MVCARTRQEAILLPMRAFWRASSLLDPDGLYRHLLDPGLYFRRIKPHVAQNLQVWYLSGTDSVIN